MRMAANRNENVLCTILLALDKHCSILGKLGAAANQLDFRLEI